MATPKAGYRNSAGVRVPGTTTIIGRFKDSGGLMHWAFQQGQNGANSLYEESSKAADIGTAAHSMVEAHINGESETDALKSWNLDKEAEQKAENAYSMYLKWESQTKLKMLSKYQELQLVSEQYQFGGTPDAIGEIDGELVLLDWKTSNGVYQDYLIQLAAYKHLWEENYPDRPITGGFHLCRFPKEFADFDHRYFTELDEAWEQFTLFRRAYNIDKTLKKRA